MISPENARRKIRYWLFALAALLLLAGGAAFFIEPEKLGIRFLALVACIASVYLIRASSVHSRATCAATSGPTTDSRTKRRRVRLSWVIGAALLPMAAASFLYLYEDALHGYQEILPVYIFAGVAALCAAAWSYLASRASH